MIVRVTFIFIAIFWVTMNVLLWRMEYGSQDQGTDVPPALVWRKILTAPDSSILNIFQNDEQLGFCQLTTGVSEEMAKMSEESPPPKNLSRGYEIKINGSVRFDNSTNQLRFDGELKLAHDRTWRELELKLSSRFVSVEIHSIATNRFFHLKIINGYVVADRDITFAGLQNPGALLRLAGGNVNSDLLDDFDLSGIPKTDSNLTGDVSWQARRVNVIIGHESTAVYRASAKLLDRYEIIFYVSTLGEILRVELPAAGMKASLDEWSQP